MTMPKTEENTDIIESALFFRVEDEDTHVDVQIYRLEEQNFWTLVLVNADGVSTVWDDEFPTEDAALQKAVDAIEEKGLKKPMMH